MKTRASCLISLRFATSDHLTLACPAGRNRSTFNLPLLCLLTFLPARLAQAGPDPVTVSNNVATAQGNQSSGIASGTDFFSPPVNTLNVNSLSGAIQPGVNQAGISFVNGTGNNVIIHSGMPGSNVVIQTSGSGAGISAQSTGNVTTLPPPDPLLGIRIPTAASVPGGLVSVDSYSDITSTGNGACGIVGTSQTAGYPQSVLTGLEAFTNSGLIVSFTVTSVDGSSTNIGQTVQGVLVDTNGLATGGSGGTFTLNADGSFTFSLGNGFTNMAIGTTQQVIAIFNLAGSSANGTNLTTGTAIAEIIRTTNGFTVEQGAYSDTYGPCLGTNSVVPDLTNYVASLIGTAQAGGAGNSVSITNHGSISTGGTAAHGIYAESLGGNGGTGSGGSISHSAGAGGSGQLGGNVEVEADGLITTTGAQACAVLAVSQGGNGGDGGNGGFWRYGARGGNGTNGGTVLVTGNGTLYTYGDQASGILAVSQGGYGGSGGNGKAFTGGGNGGFGGQGGDVIVAGNWNITTEGDAANGIWAKSAGGNAGSGGSGGWLVGAPGGGGIATDGGTVSVDSGGSITTLGQNSIGIYAESIGGFGGSGGTQTGIFYSQGGDGNSAGSGGEVDVTQEASGQITTYGTNSHGILAQSVGGGGGSGGAAGAIAGVGGQGGAGGFGGTVNVTNYGKITTYGTYARGIFAQSVGGGGGDGGNGGGVAGIGGSGSGTSPGGLVTVANFGSITTTGSLSDAIFAQSVGGGGGSAGGGSGLVGIGGSGSAGGSGSNVMVINSGQLQTLGLDARGIVAQSIGGGGGDGGTGAGLAGIGGSGSGTSPGGDVSVVNSGTINSSAQAIFAQSIGGGGGNGGSSDGWFSFGGSGGGGGNGGVVTVNNSGNLTNSENNAAAIFAQSGGGGGGNGGNSVAVGAFVSVAVGGSGGKGGNGNQVMVNSGANTIETYGNNSHGIQAQSVGGGGGNGGFAFSGSVGTGFSAAIGIGGTGGNGGAASNVVVNSASAITTYGTNAHAIFAQSVGGGGGSGGFSIAVTGSEGPSLSLSIGGQGGGGGNGESVTVTNSGELQTWGDRSYGILAQSVGGGGGDGGFSVSAAGSLGGLAAPLSFGGPGATGGMGGMVFVSNSGQIITHSNDANGIMAQSVGGGGGSGGFSVAGSVSSGGALSLSFGGAGGAGSASSDVTVQNTGDITTYGDRSDGILVQSVGGGGGNGGFSVAGSISSGPAASLSLGGSGGSGASGGDVTLDNSGSIVTFGNDAQAIFAQSVGGGGGNGGFSVAGSISASSGALGASLGGSGSGGGDAGAVSVTSTGAEIITSGERSSGILAQSVGGGGGNGGFSVAAGLSQSASISLSLGGDAAGGGNGGAVTVTNASSIVTSNANSHAIFAQSVGGGGGSDGFSVAGSLSASSGAVSASLGGTGGQGGSGSNVVVETTGASLMTYGEQSDGVLAQSVGGGGGDGGFSVAGSISKSASVSLSLGGSGGSASTGGNVEVDSSSAITTYGTNAHAIFAQSVGGGGGSGGFSVAGSISADSASIGASIGGSGGAGGSAGTVVVNSTGEINTFGDHSDGILAQSIGGGGGDGGFAVAGGISKGPSLNFAIGGSGTNGGAGGTVKVTSTANITTCGEVALGILAQSVGGGGGSGGFAVSGGISEDSGGLSFSLGGAGGPGGSAGDVSVLSEGDIVTTNQGSHAIVAQSIGGGGGNGGFAGSLVGGFGQSGANLSVSIGGNGGIGGTAGNVGVTNLGSIWTGGDDAYGILAQSVGGGGGNGGFGLAANLGTGNKSIGLDVAIGGDGATGGVASAVSVINQGEITTEGSNSFGILAQSIGGGGGNGGFSVAGSLSTSTNANQINVAVGGNGGSGNDAGQVTVGNYSDITTYGQSAVGILAQSIGGGGGNGGESFAGSLTQEGARTLAVAVGGSGGAGGNGNVVEVTNAGVIVTTNDDAHGIYAQSVGGGGGRGGSSTTIAWSAGSASSNSVSLNLDFSIGGSGGAAGNGSNVVVVNQGRIDTSGDDAYGIFAQSVGGGGGDGGNAKIEQQDVGLSNLTNLVSNLSPYSTSTNSSTESHSLSVNIGAGFGGNGGAAGTGGAVSVNNIGDIFTRGASSLGIFAQSVGGGGGVGGSSDSETGGGSGDTAIGLNLNVGGAGGGGGAADAVTVTSTGSIATLGDDSHGIMAQSVGGGGGAGGASTSKLADSATNTTLALNATVGIGGQGGVAGDGGSVMVTNLGSIDTSGRSSYGILAQSVGGGGGFGGDATLSHADDNSGGAASADVASTATSSPSDSTTNSSSGEDKSWSISVAVGAAGAAGSAGSGGTVTVNNSGDIFTRGTNSLGIFAQSVGGGGGVGGASGTETGGSSADSALEVGVSLGGQGGEGGAGGAVTVTSQGSIITLGDGAHAIMAQSVGGGGGAGGASVSGLAETPSGGTNAALNVTVGIGGSGGMGGNGSNVVVVNQGRLNTSGYGAYGILAQSIGGGGGFGGDARVEPAGQSGGATTNADNAALASAADAGSNGWNVNVSVALGGSGGTSGMGGAVTVTNSGGITTRGDASDAIMAQSVGGGGGAGGASVFSPGTNSPTTLSVRLGGGGGSGNDGGQVTVVNQGSIETWGAQSYGILAQSIGGGGGSGGNASVTNGAGASNWSLNVSLGGNGAGAANGGDVTVINTGDVLTHGDNAHGIFAQSIGGGGGDGGYGSQQSDGSSLAIEVGGSAGSSGNGGNVTVVQAGNVTTLGNGAFGVFAQSVGGGGGVGGAGVLGATGNIGLGGAGGAGGNGGDVTINLTGNITTAGAGTYGIFAQSIGGGGGLAGDLNQGLSTGAGGSTNLGVGLAFARSGGGGGNGGAVTVNSAGQIVTYGDGSCGIFAQSVGGGGGAAGSLSTGALTLNSAGSAGAAGSGGDITINHTGDIYTYGNDSHGIFIQSAGGQDDGGKISLELAGSIHVEGTNSDAVYVQSVGEQKNADMSVTLLDGSVVGGVGSGAAVRFSDGAQNTLYNFSALSTGGADVIVGGTGDDTINNNGLVVGSIDLGSGLNAFYNYGGGRVESSAILNLGAGNRFINAGVLAPGGQSAIQRTLLTGNFLQTSTGVLQIKLGSGGVSDQLAVSGTATINGTLSVSTFNGFVPAKGDQFTFLTAGQGLTGEFASLDGPNYALMLNPVYQGNSIVLQTLQGSFLPFAHTLNQHAVAQNLDSVSGLGTVSGDPREAKLVNYLDTIPGPSLGADFDLIAPEELGSLFDMSGGVADVTALNVQERTRELRSGHAGFGQFSINDPHAGLDTPWPQSGDGSDPLPNDPSPNDWHPFALGSGQIIDVEDTPNASGYDIYTTDATLGADRLASDDFGYGLTASYLGDKAYLVNGGRVTADGAHGGLFATFFGDNAYLNGAVGGGYNYFDTRRASIGGYAVGSTDGYELDALLGSGYDFKRDRLTLGPVASLQYTYVNIAGFTESGSMAPLQIENNDNNSLRSLFGGRVAYDFMVHTTIIRPELQLGWQHEFLDAEHTINSRFASGAGNIFSVQSPTVGRDDLAVSAAITVQWSERLSTFIGYIGELACQNASAATFNGGLTLSF